MPSPFSVIAGDVNNSGSVTAADMTQIRRLILGLQNIFPVGTYRFLPELYLSNATFTSALESNPFTAIYNGLAYPAYLESELPLNMNYVFAAYPETWSCAAIKGGDVNGSMTLDNLGGGGDDGLIDVLTGTGPCISASDILTVSVDATNTEEDIIAYQLGIGYDKEELIFLGAEEGDLPDFKLDNFSTRSGIIRTLWYKDDATSEDLGASKTLFKLHFKVKKSFCDVNNAVYLDNDILKSVFYGGKSNASSPTELTINWVKNVEDPKGTVSSVYPNPTSNNISFAIHLDEPAAVKYRVWDYLGNEVVFENAYASGDHTYTFSSTSSLLTGPLNYSVKIDDFVYSGIVIKTP